MNIGAAMKSSAIFFTVSWHSLYVEAVGKQRAIVVFMMCFINDDDVSCEHQKMNIHIQILHRCTYMACIAVIRDVYTFAQ